MPVGGLDSVGIQSALTAQAERQAAEDEVGKNQFLEMLVAQLENQDPLNPQDSAEFAAQLAQFSTVEQLVAMRAGIDQLVALGQSGGGASGGGSSAASSLDPMQLIGREVVVFGSQIEVDSQQSLVRMPLRTIDEATRAEVVVRDANGVIRHRASILPTSEDGLPTSLRPGDHEFVFDPAARNLAPGVYSIEFVAADASGDPVTVLPMVEGLVTGAIVAGDPSIRLGNRVFSVDDVLEVRIAGTAGGAGSTASGAAGAAVGGGQLVFQRPTGAAPQGVTGS